MLGVFLIWYSIYSATPEERQTTLRYISQADPIWVILSILLGLLSHILRAYRWKFLLDPLDYNIKLSNSFMAIMAGYLSNLGIPRSGEVLRAGLATTYEKIPFQKAFGTIISERLVDLLLLIVVVISTLLLESGKLYEYLGDTLTSPVQTLFILLAIIGIGILLLRVFKNSSNTFVQKIRSFGEGLLEGIRSIFKMKKKVLFITYSVLIWALYIIMFDVVRYTVPATADLHLGAMLVAFVAGTLAYSTTNGGIGAYPLAIGYALLLYGVEESAGKAFGWILWSAQTALTLLIGALSFLFLPILNKVE
ncbi:flippase-like domain-containing protein [Aquimarina sp. ERC-38]|uniref:lysylphosphatidylglycerol synthase transmembrane domain-containing protein n=1 Tax=Aquimarina sp. ERC-38 TaxID=2949996 RepID=UPI0022470AEB|nr:lysylphosphatidylglycerol synthase transmembrane domain-containing protein [Aquimarina sp. ERC-38]UZO82157.1 flippase-like domain-containing protein [Aquimarina sp. ERC-38]